MAYAAEPSVRPARRRTLLLIVQPECAQLYHTVVLLSGRFHLTAVATLGFYIWEEGGDGRQKKCIRKDQNLSHSASLSHKHELNERGPGASLRARGGIQGRSPCSGGENPRSPEGLSYPWLKMLSSYRYFCPTKRFQRF